jgi:hypothetical protein
MEWPAVVTALSTAAIAMLLALPAIASFLLIAQLRRAVKAAERFGTLLQQEVMPAIQSARRLADQASEMGDAVKGEVSGIVETSRDLRGRLVRAADATEGRLNDLEALLDVLYQEVEDTVLDVAAALRTTRRGASLITGIKRAIRRRGR